MSQTVFIYPYLPIFWQLLVSCLLVRVIFTTKQIKAALLQQSIYSIFLLFAGLSIVASPTYAYQRSYTNLGFETPDIATGTNVCRLYVNNTKVTGWLTTHPFYREEVNGTLYCRCS